MTGSELAADAVVVVDLGGTRLRTAVFDAPGEIRYHTVVRTPPADAGALTYALIEAHEAATTAGLHAAHAVVGVPGWVDYRANRAVTLPNLPAWGTIDGAGLAQATGIEVHFGNDADFATLGEHSFGAGRGVRDLVYVTCSTGVGAGVLLDERLVRSHRSVAEIGHTVIDRHSGETVEDIASGTALARRAGAPAEVVASRATAGDPRAAKLFRESADALGIGVVNMALLFGPERVVIGGGMSAAGDLLLGPVRDRIARARSPLFDLRPEDIVLAERSQDAGLVGAYAFWRDELRQ